MKGKGVGGIILNLIIVAAGIKILMFVADGYIRSADTAGSFYQLISSFTAVGDFLFYGLAALVVLLIPYWFYKQRHP